MGRATHLAYIQVITYHVNHKSSLLSLNYYQKYNKCNSIHVFSGAYLCKISSSANLDFSPLKATEQFTKDKYKNMKSLFFFKDSTTRFNQNVTINVALIIK